jgi:signal transduction histidine kinase
VLANPAALTQIISNLLSNAIKFVAPGTQPQVRIWAEADDATVRLCFKDNGIGIPKKAQHKLFGLFQRLHPYDAYDGTGIGLAIVRKAAERMGGEVGVESEPGQGSEFWVKLQCSNHKDKITQLPPEVISHPLVG